MDIPTFDELMEMSDDLDLPATDLLLFAGILIDKAHNRDKLVDREAGTVKALRWCDLIEGQDLTGLQQIDLSYFRANAWHNRIHARDDLDGVWDWHQPAIEHQIFYLREAVNHTGFSGASEIRRSEILTNLSNQLNTVGRFVEALEMRERVLSEKPDFFVALGNRGLARVEYAQSIYLDQNKEQLFWAAYQDLRNAVTLGRVSDYHDPGAVEAFERKVAELEAHIPIGFLQHDMEFIEYGLGETPSEQAYRQWALDAGLFLNPLNDLGPYTAAAADTLLLPDIYTGNAHPPIYFGFFNQLKQEYVSARWLYFEGVTAGEHFSDKDVVLGDVVGYPRYGLALEKVKLAFRATYSLFDKVALFLNAYMAVGLEPKQVNFKSLWWEKVPQGRRAGVLRPPFVGLRNWPLQGLFWLSKDLFDDTFTRGTDPDARNLKVDRDHVEHRYFQVRDSALPEDALLPLPVLAHSVLREDLAAKTLRLLKLARAAFIYLACAMSVEERRRRRKALEAASGEPG